jgi:hypothetical protein
VHHEIPGVRRIVKMLQQKAATIENEAGHPLELGRFLESDVRIEPSRQLIVASRDECLDFDCLKAGCHVLLRAAWNGTISALPPSTTAGHANVNFPP